MSVNVVVTNLKKDGSSIFTLDNNMIRYDNSTHQNRLLIARVKHKKIDIAILDSYIKWQNVQNVEQILNLAAMIQKN